MHKFQSSGAYRDKKDLVLQRRKGNIQQLQPVSVFGYRTLGFKPQLIKEHQLQLQLQLT